MKDFHLPLYSRSVFSRIGVVPARKIRRIPFPKIDSGTKVGWAGRAAEHVADAAIMAFVPKLLSCC